MRPRAKGREDWPKNMYQRPSRNNVFFWKNPFTRRVISLGRDMDEAVRRANEENDKIKGLYEIRSGQAKRSADLLSAYALRRIAVSPESGMCGIYFLLDAGEVVYVGKSINVGGRIREHRRDKLKTFDKFAFVQCKPEDLDETEARYIQEFQPKYNFIQNPSRRKSVRSFVPNLDTKLNHQSRP